MFCFLRVSNMLTYLYFSCFSLFFLHKPHRVTPQSLRQQKYRLHIKRSLAAFDV